MKLSKSDLEQIKKHGLDEKEILLQLALFEKGFPFVLLDRPATVGDGIRHVPKEAFKEPHNLCNEAIKNHRVVKFIPASGAASRMFQDLLAYREQINGKKAVSEKAEGEMKRFAEGLRQFAFYEDLKKTLAKHGKDIDALAAEKKYGDILDALLFSDGLNYAHLPKALLKFHGYKDGARSALLEHLIEGMTYTEDKLRKSHVHLTVSPEFSADVQITIARFKTFFTEELGAELDITVSVQKASTDTLAADLSNKPFRDAEGKLMFRPGGHGALLTNLAELKGDIVFIKNIDNISCDRLKYQTYEYKKLLGGLLIKLQNKVFEFVRKLGGEAINEKTLAEMLRFAEDELSVAVPKAVKIGKPDEKANFLSRKFNRPIRVCGMVKNEGEPGGGPFWVRGEDGEVSLQIVEGSQIQKEDPAQKEILASATHFNPVDLVCGVRDHKNELFDLMKFQDPQAVFIAVKSKDGKKLKALERPGLWNGAMADWITIFVEVPITTFSPVKTVNDLLRKEHQCT